MVNKNSEDTVKEISQNEIPREKRLSEHIYQFVKNILHYRESNKEWKQISFFPPCLYNGFLKRIKQQ